MDGSECRRCLRLVSVLLFFSMVASGALLAQVTVDFELGDSQQPEVPGTGDILSVSNVAGPDWQELFNANGTLRDDVDAAGVPPGNGIPDFIDLHGGVDALFVGDDISGGTTTDFTIRHPGGRLQTGPVASLTDLTNAYVYLTKNTAGDLLLYAGLERTGTGAAIVELEFNQGHIRLGKGWPDTIGWEIKGQETAKDLRITLDFPDPTAGEINSIAIDAWEDPESDGTFAWIRKETLTAEGCNAGDALCAFLNQSSIAGGDWPSYDATGTPVTSLGPDCFVEVGVNVGSLLAIVDPTYKYKTVQLRSADDLAFGYFGEGN